MKLSPLQALRAAADFASRTAARKNIHQVLFTWTGEQLYLRATDGHTLCSISIPSTHEPGSCAIDRSDILQMLEDIKRAGAKDFTPVLDPSGVRVGEKLYTRSDATSPPHGLVLERSELCFEMIKPDRKALAAAVQAVKPADRKNLMRRVSLTASGDTLTVEGHTVPCESTCGVETTLSWALLARALKWAPRGELRLAVEQPTSGNHRVFIEVENYTAVLIGSP